MATDIAARGLDIERLPYVVNFELPHVPEDNVHRIGRTGRAGETGEAISLVSSEETKLLIGIQRLLAREIPSEVIAGFEPTSTHPGPSRPARPRDHRDAYRGNRDRRGTSSRSRKPRRRGRGRRLPER